MLTPLKIIKSEDNITKKTLNVKVRMRNALLKLRPTFNDPDIEKGFNVFIDWKNWMYFDQFMREWEDEIMRERQMRRQIKKLLFDD
jgi:hypothetical protein